MAYDLISVLKYEACTFQMIIWELNNHSWIEEDINQVIDGFTPLQIAILRNHSVDILEKLLKFKADINKVMRVFYAQYPGEYHSCLMFSIPSKYDFIRKFSRLYIETVWKLHISTLLFFIIFKSYVEATYFTQMLQLMLQYADQSTKTTALNSLLLFTLRNSNTIVQENGFMSNNCIQALKMLLKSGAEPQIEMKFCYNAVKKNSAYLSKETVHFIMSVFETYLPYFCVWFFSESGIAGGICRIWKWVFRFVGDIIDDAISSNNQNVFKSANDIETMMYNSLKIIQANYIKATHKMQFDFLENKQTVYQVLRGFLKGNSEKVKIANEVVYEMILKFGEGEYHLFTDFFYPILDGSNINIIYFFISTSHFVSGNWVHPDTFCYITKFLSKKDMCNYLLAFVSSRKKR